MTELEQYVNQTGRDELVKQVREKIDELGITYIYYQFISVTGRIVGKGNYIGYGPEASELVGIPDPETFCQLPWDKRVARVFCVCFRNREERDNPGGFLTSDCRGNLKRIHQEFKDKHDLELRAGTEPEMMWLKRGEDGKPADGFSKPYCYHIDQFESLRPVFMQVIEYCQAMGLEIRP